MGRGSGYSMSQILEEVGNPGMPGGRDGTQGDLGPLAGIQPAPHGYGSGRQRERRGAPRDQLQRCQAGPDGFRAEVGGGAAGGTRWAGGCNAEGGGVPAGGRPAGTLGAAGAGTKAEAGQAADATTPRR